jgi:hypothetical protein
MLGQAKWNYYEGNWRPVKVLQFINVRNTSTDKHALNIVAIVADVDGKLHQASLGKLIMEQEYHDELS